MYGLACRRSAIATYCSQINDSTRRAVKRTYTAAVKELAVSLLRQDAKRPDFNTLSHSEIDAVGYVIVRPQSTVGYTSVVESVIHSRQWSN